MNKTKVDIISGFLGAGKTTFIRKMMQDLYSRDQVVILENEFGKINIDKETLGREGYTVKPIHASCICCTGILDLTTGIKDILREFGPDRIIIEPTGIAKLSDVKKILLSKELNELCDIDHVITIVDARNYRARIMVSKDFFENQLRSSEVIFLSKTDGMDTESINNVETEIQKIQPSGLIVKQPWDEISASQLKTLIEYKNETKGNGHQVRMLQYHNNDFESYEIITEHAIASEVIKNFLKEAEHGAYGEVHRVKGIFCNTDGNWLSVEFVPGEVILLPIERDKVTTAQSMLCILGRELQRDKLDHIFE
jgi:G3E family GTPase